MELSRLNRMSWLAALMAGSASVLASSCAAPGAPTLLDAEIATGVPVLANCQNIAPNVRVTRLEKDHYFTTYGSILQEIGQQTVTDVPRMVAAEAGAAFTGRSEPYGTVAGNVIGRTGDLASGQVQTHDRLQGRRLNRLGQEPPGFCRAFQSSQIEVSRALAEAMASLGHPMKISDLQNGVFETEFADGQHRDAMWMDRYRATVEPLDSGLVGVRVRRQVFISRETSTSGTGTIYNQAIPSGHGESWILTRVTDELAGRPNVSTVATAHPR